MILYKALEKVPDTVTAETFSEKGSPAVVILDFASSENRDMIIIGSRGIGVVKGVLLGNVSQCIVEQAKCLAHSHKMSIKKRASSPIFR